MTIGDKKSTQKPDSGSGSQPSAEPSLQPPGTVISFESAAHPHVHIRKEKKFNRVKSAFKAVTDEVFGGGAKKSDRKTRKRKKKNKKR